MRRIITSTILAAALAACAPVTKPPSIDSAKAAEEAERQYDAAVSEKLAAWDRLFRVGRRVMIANADQCSDKIGTIGATFMGRFWSIKQEHPALERVTGIDADAFVLSVAPDSPAARAGILPRDTIVSVNGVPVSDGVRSFNAEVTKMGTLHLVVRRGGDTIERDVSPVAACAYMPGLVPVSQVNAFATGDAINVTLGMMRFAKSDDELALVIGHELAHNTMGHLEKKRANAMMTGVLWAALGAVLGAPGPQTAGFDAGAMLYTQEFEAEADYVGVYLSARAGYDTKSAADLWRRMATENPGAIGLTGTTHPSTATRFLAVQAASDEVVAKRAAGEPLTPNK